MATKPNRPRWRRVAVRAAKVVLVVLLILIVTPYVLAVVYRGVNPVSTVMLERRLAGERVVRTWVPLEEFSREVPLAVVVAEDGQFCHHRGVDFRELWSAFTEVDDLREARGGSTITQQTAKNLFLWSSRSFVRKALELPLAVWLELVLGKRRILEIYLNIAEWGPNGEFGAEEGARRAFDKGASSLSAQQAAWLASELPNPHRRDARAPDASLRAVVGVHLGRMDRMKSAADCLWK